MKFYKNDIIEHGRKLGIEQGDFLFITADLLNVRYFNKDIVTTEQDWIDILMEWVGKNGDFIVASYTDSFLKFKKDKNIIFHRFSDTTSGSLSKILVNDHRFIRSRHPTNSYVGFGKKAELILNKHDHHSTSYSVIDDMLNYNVKNLLLGTIDKKNAAMSFHQVLHNMGYNYKHPFCNLGQSYYYDLNNVLRLFTRKDVGGCSSGCFKLLPELINLSKSNIGHIGSAKSLLLDGIQANNKIIELLSHDLSNAKCLDKQCISCYGRLDNFFFFIPYLLNLSKIFKKLIG